MNANAVTNAMSGNMEKTPHKDGPQWVKVGVDRETKDALDDLKRRTGIPHVRLAHNAIMDYARKLRRRHNPAA
jgi:hypothetical protein